MDMIKHITLVCMAGLTTSLMVNKMRKVAEEENLEVEINAMSERAFQGHEELTDVLLLGPQIQYRFQDLKECYEPLGVKVAVIDSVQFQKMDAKAVLEEAMRLCNSMDECKQV